VLIQGWTRFPFTALAKRFPDLFAFDLLFEVSQ
jgi:hypothetical protein